MHIPGKFGLLLASRWFRSIMLPVSSLLVRQAGLITRTVFRSISRERIHSQGLILAALASDLNHEAPRYMISVFSKLCFWTPGSDDLLYVTELYSLTRILRHVNTDSSEPRTKILKRLSHHYFEDQPVYRSLWFCSSRTTMYPRVGRTKYTMLLVDKSSTSTAYSFQQFCCPSTAV